MYTVHVHECQYQNTHTHTHTHTHIHTHTHTHTHTLTLLHEHSLREARRGGEERWPGAVSDGRGRDGLEATGLLRGVGLDWTKR